MTNSAVSSRSNRLRILALTGALALGLGLMPTGAAFADPGDPSAETGETVSGTVTNEVSGAGVGGVPVQIAKSDYSWFGSTTTDAAGAYAFTDVLPGDYSVSVSLYVFPTGPLPYGYEPAVSTTITSGNPALVDFALTPYASGTSLLTGSITDAHSGLPLTGANISLSGVTVAYSGSTTSSFGAYSITDLAAGRYYVSVWMSDYLTASAEVEISAAGATWDAALTPLDAAITGRVTDASGDGIPGIWVEAGGLGQIMASPTNSDGYFTIVNLAAGAYTVSVGGPPSLWTRQQVPTTTIAEAAVTVDLQLVARTTSMVSSAVFDVNYNGIAYICVDLIDVATGAVVESTESLSDAVFGFPEVADGTYTLYLEDCAVSRPRIYESTYLGGASTLADAETFTIAGPANDQRPDDIFLAGPATGAVTLAVTDAATGAPLAPGVNGYLVFDSVSYPFSDWTETGTLQIRDLQYGDYDFYVVAAGYVGQLLENVQVDAASSNEVIDVALAEVTTGSITVTVANSSTGTAIGGATATYTDAGGAHTVADGNGDGVIALPELAFGSYVLTVKATGYVTATLGSITIDSGAPNATAAARLAPVVVDNGHGHGHSHGHGHHCHGSGHGYGHVKHDEKHHDRGHDKGHGKGDKHDDKDHGKAPGKSNDKNRR